MSAFHELVSSLDYPMYIVTARAGGQGEAASGGQGEADGCLVGFATQASIDPPRILVLVSKANRTHRAASTSSQLAVHFLHAANGALAALFGAETGDDVDKFARCEWRQVEGVAPPVLTGTRGWVAGPVLDRMDCGDHTAMLVAAERSALDVDGPQLGFQAVENLPPGHPA